MSETLPASGELRACPKCARPIPIDALRCRYCFFAVTPVEAKVFLSPSRSEEDIASGIVRRYRDAYAVAWAIVQQGEMIKTVAIFVACVIFAVFFFASFGAESFNEGKLVPLLIIFGLAVAGFFWAMIHAHGIRVCAEGQMLLASLDTAVNTSPLIENSDRIEAMRR
ncbi:MAG: hypothetical protein JWO56_3685 [Acidobacteria bacterium]|nr:hypothetical protein [Acidobacteriota bacterium]